MMTRRSDHTAADSPIRARCRSRRATELDELAAFRRSGGIVAGTTCHAFPAAVLAGLGLRPLRVLCEASAVTENAGEQVVRPDVCPLVKTLLGSVHEGRGIHAAVDLWIGLFTCDAMRRGMDVLASRLGREVHPLQLPATRTPESARYFADQVRRLVTDLEARHGLRFDPARATAWQREQDRAAAVLSRAARSGRVSPLDLHALFHLFFIARPEGLAEFIEGQLASAPPYDADRTVIVAGSPLALEDTVVFAELEARGYGAVPLACTGLNAVEDGPAIADAGDPIGRLALRSFQQPPCARSRPNTAVYDRIADAVREARPAGLIVKALKFCDHWYTERERMRRTFDLPVLVVDSDYAEGGRERLLSRIDAFLETLG